MLRTHPLTADIGLEVLGLDLREPPSDEVRAELRDLVDGAHLLLFRNQHLDPDENVGVLEWFGPVCDELEDGKKWSIVANDVSVLVPREHALLFHQDFSFTQTPHLFQSLFGLEVKGEVVPTVFASCAGGVDRLPSELRKRLESLDAVHFIDARDGTYRDPSRRTTIYDLPAGVPEDLLPQTIHPVIKAHPRTGEALLFVDMLMTSHIVGVDQHESDALLQRCFEVLYDESHLYRHQWQVGDLVVWDNVALQHAREAERPGARRCLRRVNVNGRSMSELMPKRPQYSTDPV
jgi:taurine dioxygenase